jgi:hypothetical protein
MAKIVAGFTGTQKGMTVGQVRKLKELLESEGVSELHHGDCIGADARADSIAHELNIDVVIHPPTKADKRAYCEGYKKIHEPKEYLVRNKDIVNDSRILFATPGEPSMVLRSGTWSTVRFGIKSKRKVFVIKPDGEVDIYN